MDVVQNPSRLFDSRLPLHQATNVENSAAVSVERTSCLRVPRGEPQFFDNGARLCDPTAYVRADEL